MLLKLYCNLRVVPIAFTTKHSSFAIFWVADFLSRPKSLLALRFFYRHFGNAELLAPRSKKLRNVLYGIILARWCGGFWGVVAAVGLAVWLSQWPALTRVIL